jgi:hypothetical protein
VNLDTRDDAWSDELLAWKLVPSPSPSGDLKMSRASPSMVNETCQRQRDLLDPVSCRAIREPPAELDLTASEVDP